MVRRFSVNFAILSIVTDMGLTFLALSLSVYVRPSLPDIPFLVPVSSIEVSPLIYGIIPTLWVVTFLLGSVYDPKNTYRIVDELQRVTLATGVATLLFAGVLYFFFREFSRWLLVIFVLLDLSFLIGWRVLARLIFRLGHPPASSRRVLIVGAGEVGQRVGEMIENHYWSGLRLAGFLDDDPEKQEARFVLGQLNRVRQIVEEQAIDDVVVALPQRAYSEVNKLALALHNLPVNVRVIPDYFSLALYRATVEDFGGIPMISLREPALNEVQRLMKRMFDLTISGIMFICTLPMLGFLALLIKLDSKGPVFFRQERIGENDRPFRMFKFRSMVVGAEKRLKEVTEITPDGAILYKRANDPRVTRVGRFLRRTSLDELPQLINVLKGDMSLVGPRPELPWMVGKYEIWQHKRFAVPQGMTGWWQVNGRSDKPMHLHTEDDIYYIQNYSLWMDIYILFKTPWVVLRGKGAY